MAKTTKISDVASPGKTVPSASSRPIIVSNHSGMAADPMLADDGKKDAADPASALVVKRVAKVIAPVSDDMKPPESVDAPVDAEQESAPEPTLEAAETPAESTPAVVAEPEEPSRVVMEDVERDAEAESSLEQNAIAAAEEARKQELERLIEAGTYAVPINAVQRKRSHVFVVMMCVLSVVLLLVLIDAVLDANLVQLPFNVPHTHFLSTRS